MKKVVWLLNEFAPSGEYSPAIYWWYGILETLGYDVIYYPYETYDSSKFLQDMKSHNPDYIFHPGYNKIHPEFAELDCEVYIVQSDDDWRFSSFATQWKPITNGVISYQNTKQSYVDEGFDPDMVHEALWAFNPNTMLTNLNVEKDIFLSHVGGLHANRRELLNEFIQKGYNVTIPQSKINYANVKDLWARSKFSLTFTMSSQGNFRQKKGRVAEIPYFTFMLSEPFKGIEDFYEPGKEIIIFNSVDEAIDKIKYYDNNPEEYNNVCNAARKRLISTNTCYHSWDVIMSNIDKDYQTKNILDILKTKHNL